MLPGLALGALIAQGALGPNIGDSLELGATAFAAVFSAASLNNAIYGGYFRKYDLQYILNFAGVQLAERSALEKQQPPSPQTAGR